MTGGSTMLANLAFDHRLQASVRSGRREPALQRRSALPRVVLVCALVMLSLAGCYKRSVLPQSEGHVTTPAANPSLADVPPPARTSDFVPPPKPTVKPPTYSVVVNEVPVKELLFALARDTKQNI